MRIAEALSKMKLQPFATEADVEEALRLFQVSTLDAALSGTLSGEEVLGLRGQGPGCWRPAGAASLHSLGFSERPPHTCPPHHSSERLLSDP